MIETARLSLRVATPYDAQILFDLNLDPDVVKYTGDSAFANSGEALKIIQKRMIPDFLNYKMTRWLIFRKEDQAFLGWCGLKYFPETMEVDLGYRLKKAFWGHGYATEASRACLSYGFTELKLERIIAKAMPENTASIKVMQKLGMTFRGYQHDPTDPIPFILYDLKKSEFSS